MDQTSSTSTESPRAIPHRQKTCCGGASANPGDIPLADVKNALPEIPAAKPAQCGCGCGHH